MISRLHGSVTKESPGEITVDIGGIGYRVRTPLSVWDQLHDGADATVHILSYVREDRFDLFGFADRNTMLLFEKLIDQPGVGPRTGLELCDVPKDLLLMAIEKEDPNVLTGVKGIGKKTAEKLILDLRGMLEKNPDLFGTTTAATSVSSAFDQDAMDALTALGYSTAVILRVLKDLPEELRTTEERVAAALRSL